MKTNLAELVKTKTFWLGLIAVATGVVYGIFDGWDKGWPYILAGAGAISGRDALLKL